MHSKKLHNDKMIQNKHTHKGIIQMIRNFVVGQVSWVLSMLAKLCSLIPFFYYLLSSPAYLFPPFLPSFPQDTYSSNKEPS